MFAEMVAGLAQGRLPAAASLRQRFDMALTKKMGVVRLPPAFWPEDPKINPRTAHLFWAALLLQDRERMDLALAALAAEQAARTPAALPDHAGLAGQARELLQQLLAVIGDPGRREELRRDLRRAVPEWLADGPDSAGEKGKEYGY